MEIMKATDEESKKALIESWWEAEAVPIDQAEFGAGTSQSLIDEGDHVLFNQPMRVFRLYYMKKQGLKYLG